MLGERGLERRNGTRPDHDGTARVGLAPPGKNWSGPPTASARPEHDEERSELHRLQRGWELARLVASRDFHQSEIRLLAEPRAQLGFREDAAVVRVAVDRRVLGQGA